jgi:RNA-dependent RNA polymerase
LIPKQDEPIYLIDAPQTGGANGVEKVIENVGYDKMLNFFIEYLNYEKLGQIDNSHLVTADRSDHWAKDADCLELAKIHGKAVDFPKTGFCPEVNPKLLVSSYPDFM